MANLLKWLILFSILMVAVSCHKNAAYWWFTDGWLDHRPAKVDSTKIKSLVLPDELIPSNKYCWITGSTVNVRKKPTTDSEVLAKVHRADRAVFLGEESDWVMIEWTDGDTAYVHKSLVSYEEIIDAITLFERRIRKNDPSGRIINGVKQADDIYGKNLSKKIAYIYVTDEWYKTPYYEKERFAEVMFDVWINCLVDTGNRKYGVLFIIDCYSKEVAEVRYGGFTMSKIIVEIKR